MIDFICICLDRMTGPFVNWSKQMLSTCLPLWHGRVLTRLACLYLQPRPRPSCQTSRSERRRPNIGFCVPVTKEQVGLARQSRQAWFRGNSVTWDVAVCAHQRTHKSDGWRSGSAAGHSSFGHNFPLKFSRPGHYAPLPCEIEYRYHHLYSS